MTGFVMRLGKSIVADEVFHAWMSRDLGRMLAATTVATNPIDRHFLLMNIVDLSYKNRKDPEARRICREIGLRHLEEFAALGPSLAQHMGGVLPRVPTFAHLATLLAEDGDVQQAVVVCQRAHAFGLHDGTKGDYPARIERLRKKHTTADHHDA